MRKLALTAAILLAVAVPASAQGLYVGVGDVGVGVGVTDYGPYYWGGPYPHHYRTHHWWGAPGYAYSGSPHYYGYGPGYAYGYGYPAWGY
jgi:hypothetical protein